MYHGIINIDKEKGYTSHDVVARLRGILKQKKIGHTGTLDPDATGVLPVCLGQGTKLCDMLTDHSKQYRAVLLLGKETDTEDISGTVLAEKEVSVGEDEVCETIKKFVGEYDQIPPMYSAIKVNGKKLYQLAREGKTIERQPRHVCITEIVVEKIELPRVTMMISCSKGTYIRSLCRDIGAELGCGGCMESLVRTQVGSFFLKDAIRLDQVEELVKEGRIEKYIVPIENAFLEYPALCVKEETEKALQNGNPLRQDGLVGWETAENREGFLEKMPESTVRVYDRRGYFTGLYEFQKEKGLYFPKKMFLGNGI